MTASEKAFEKHWDAVGHCQRMRDKKDLMGLNKGMRVADFAKPSDYVVSSPNTALHYAEVKETRNKTSFPFSKIRPSQVAAAMRESSRGYGAYIFYIFSYEHSKWFVLDCKQFAEMVGNKQKSVKFEELDEWIK